MKRTSPYYPLQWRVDCRPPGQHFFETIAAFNHIDVAVDYARDCWRPKAQRLQNWKYRVMERRGTVWHEVKTFD